jgi:alkylation response protein AidB-like acyl-CoA dehydrogenase
MRTLSPAALSTRSAIALESYLGSPTDPVHPLGLPQALARDEAERPPTDAHRLLTGWGLPDHLVPLRLGGRWRSIEELLGLLRVVARRDPTVAFGFGPSLLGALPVWIAGTPAQQDRVTDLLRGGAGLALANTERAHGTDILANQTRAVPCEGGYRLTGEKWLISNATTCAAWVVFARTAPTNGPRSHSLFLVEKADLDPDTWGHLPRVPTLGLRGGDLSGVRFRDCHVPASALIGAPGAAFDLVHRTLTVTRTLCAGLALGAADTALSLVTTFATARHLFDRRVADLPVPRSLLVGAFVDLLLADVVATVAARAVQAGHAPLFFSALAKYFVPVRIERVFRDLALVLGARFYLRAGHPGAVFQKLLRDSAIVSVFEGNTLVQQSLLAGQLARLAEAPGGSSGSLPGALLALDQPQAPIDPSRLHGRGRSEDVPLLALPGRPLDADAGRLDPLLRHQARRYQHWQTRWARHRSEWTGQGGTLSPRLAHLVTEYAELYAVALAYQFWRANRDELGRFFRRGDWLRLTVGRQRPAPAARVARELFRRCRDGEDFGVRPVPLGEMAALRE